MLNIDALLLPTDFTPCSEQARAYAASLARRYGAAVHILHVIPTAPSYPLFGVGGETTEVPDEVRAQMETFTSADELNGLTVRTAIQRHEQVAETVLSYADEHDVACIVTGTHGRQGVQRFLMGSEAESIIRGAEHPVWAVRMRETEEASARDINRILVPVDLSGEGGAALAHATALARDYEAHLDLLHVIEYFPEYDLPSVYGPIATPLSDSAVSDVEARVLEMLDEEARTLDVPDGRLRTHAVYGRAASYIAEFANEEGADLIVITTHGRTGVERYMLGSVTERVLRAAPCPVFVLKADGYSLVGARGPGA